MDRNRERKKKGALNHLRMEVDEIYSPLSSSSSVLTNFFTLGALSALKSCHSDVLTGSLGRTFRSLLNGA